MPKTTPMMKQYFEMKEEYDDCILFFRLGDFYEMFFEDAVLASKELEITLTSRGGKDSKTPMCGVPHHSSAAYIAKLVEKGYKVAICEQVEDPADAVGIVKREVVRVVTPGTIIDNHALDDKSNNYLCCAYLDTKNNGLGFSYVDISTGELYTTEVVQSKKPLSTILIDEIAKVKPTELIVNDDLMKYLDVVDDIKKKFNILINPYPDWTFEYSLAEDNIKEQFEVLNLEGLDLVDKKHSTISTGALLEYLNETQKIALNHINSVNVYSLESYMVLDISTRRNLELVETIRGQSKKGTLLNILDKTSTSMGARLLRRWIQEPLIEKEDIEARLNIIDYFVKDIVMLNDIKDILKGINDIDRLISKVTFGSCNGRDLISLKQSISRLPDLKRLLMKTNNSDLSGFGDKLDPLKDIFKLIDKSIVDEPPINIKEGNLIKANYNEELGELKEASIKGKEWLSDLEEQERRKTGIKNLKVKYNKVFGYFLEVSKGNISLVPDYFERKQTLVNAERYITDELKVMEDKILGSEDKMISLEYDIFIEVREEIKGEIERIQTTSKLVSNIDVLNSLSQVSFENNYIKPNINTEGFIDIKGGRHPVVEEVLENEQFVPNNTLLDKDENRLAIITGPNMSGKSTYMRQVALITLMSQIGCFVPAESAEISIVDRIFTRIGATDDLSQGQSTFMVEMNEVANILNNATKDSLIILDEIGRGTSTYDGLSIAWSVTEYISDKNKVGAKTLFATHYHELTELESKLDGVKNYKIAVKENEHGNITFLRTIVRGEADRSYGIEVAKLAGVRKEVIDRACEILKSLEENDINNNIKNIKFMDDAVTVDEEDKYKDSKSISIDSNNDIANEVESIKEVKELEYIEHKEPKPVEVGESDVVKETPLELLASENRYEKLVDEIKSLDMINLTPLDAMNTLYKMWNKVQNINKD